MAVFTILHRDVYVDGILSSDHPRFGGRRLGKFAGVFCAKNRIPVGGAVMTVAIAIADIATQATLDANGCKRSASLSNRAPSRPERILTTINEAEIVWAIRLLEGRENGIRGVDIQTLAAEAKTDPAARERLMAAVRDAKGNRPNDARMIREWNAERRAAEAIAALDA